MPSLSKVCLLLLARLVITLGSECAPGQVKGLEGSCVTKFIIPKVKSKCPKLDIQHGQALPDGSSGRIFKFYCDHEYIRVPDIERAICQVMGTWSKTVPQCLKPGCQIPEVSTSMSMSVQHSSTVLQFSCITGQLSGDPTLACIDGVHWNGSIPLCEMQTTSSSTSDITITSRLILLAITAVTCGAVM